MLARCIGNGDSSRYFSAVDTLFRRQDQLISNAMGTPRSVGLEAGMSDQAIDRRLNDANQYQKPDADRRIAVEIVKGRPGADLPQQRQDVHRQYVA